jgi:choline kinase
MTAIILAAGMGRRLSMGVPKCLIEIAGQSILKRQIGAFRAVGVEHFAIVIGYRGQDVRQHVADEPGRFTFVVNERFAETNTLYSLYLARDHFGSGFFYANGDVVLDRRLASRLAASEHATVMAVKPGRWGQEEVKVTVEPGPIPGGPLARVTRIGKQLDPARAWGEFIGAARFGEEIVPAFREILTRCVELEGIVGDHFESAVDRLCAAGHEIMGIDIGDLPCGEIDFPEDLEHARRELGSFLLS